MLWQPTRPEPPPFAPGRERTTTATVLRWLPGFLGFPAGGLATSLLIGPVDGPAAALAGGALSGGLLGLAQVLALGRPGIGRGRWVLATAAGFAVGLTAGAGAVGYATGTAALAGQGALTGLAVGAAQALVLRPRLGRAALAWPALLSGLWALGWTITALAGIDVERRYSVFGSSGAIVVTAATSILPVLLSRRIRLVVAR